MRFFFIVISGLMVFLNSVYSQDINFEIVSSPAQEPLISFDFGPVSYSSVALADINNNGRQDVLITGHAIGGGRNITIYQNNGGGDFSVVDDLPFKAVSNGAMAFADVDGDGDQDLLITGRTNESTGGTIPFPKLTASLYLNDGNGVFTGVSGTPFEAVEHSSVVFADVDNDGDMDVFISGMGQDNVMGAERVSSLYLNDGTGNFSEDLTASFTPVTRSSALFMDAEDDGDMDLLLTGYSNTEKVAKLYENDGMGVFTEMSGLPFEGISSGQIANADVTNNNKKEADVIFTGLSNVGGENKGIAKLYLNDGEGLFEENTECSFAGVENSSVAFADVDGDRDKDVLIAGKDTATNKPVTKLYLNQDGSGNFIECQDNSFEGIMHGTLTFFDFDKDNDQDVLITGYGVADFSKTAVLYLNDGNGHFEKVSTGAFSGLSKPSIDYADIDNDQDQDFIISGSDTTQLYINDGKGFYTLAENTLFSGVENGAVAFADIDNDGDSDLAITGSGIADLYLNDGTGAFTLKPSSLQGASNSTVDFVDVDNDDDPDIMITGPSTNLYINDGAGNFAVLTDMPFEEDAEYGDVAFADVNGNLFEDVLITGNSLGGTVSANFTELYINNGELNFSDALGGFTGVMNSSVDFADIDGDGDLDLLVTGSSTAGLYRNNGTGSFTAIIHPFDGISNSSVAFADVDSDGDMDVVISGETGSGHITKLYVNDGTGNFSEYPDVPFADISDGCVKFLDIDNDEDPDIMISGFTGRNYITKLYRNTTCLTTYDTISVFACDEYTGPGGENTYFSSGTYNDTITNYAGCDSVITIHLTMGQLDTSVPLQGTTLTSAAEDVTYQWLDCNNAYEIIAGEESQSYTAGASGNYAVELTRSSCVDTSACHSVVISGLEEKDSKSGILIFPNPARSKVMIVGTAIQAVELVDGKGHVLKHIIPSSVPVEIDVGALNSGLYYFRITKGNNVVVKALMIE